MSLKIIYMGTPEFAVPALDEIVAQGYEVLAVYSQPPRPSGRGHNIKKSPVHTRAEELGLKVYTPVSLKKEKEQEEFASLGADVAIVAAYGLILPKAILKAPRFGCINIHASLLPRWRGAAPIQRALLAGDLETGITIMQMNEGLDTGDILLQDMVPITHSTTCEELHDRLSELGASMIVEILQDLEKGLLDPHPQPHVGVTYADKLSKDEGKLDWHESAEELERKVRALNPWPGVWFENKGEKIKVLQADIAHLNMDGTPGEVLDGQLTIACAQGALRLLKVQKPGSRAMETREFLNGYSISVGEKLS